MKGPLRGPGPVGGPVCKEKISLASDLDVSSTCVLQTWQRPTLPRLETKYHQRWSVSRPSSEWDRVQPLRHNHQVGKTHVVREAGFERMPLSTSSSRFGLVRKRRVAGRRCAVRSVASCRHARDKQ